MQFPRVAFLSFLSLTLWLALSALEAPAVEIEGRVMNGTTGEVLPGQFVNLLALRGQMVPVRETQTDDQGRFRFVIAANPNERFLVQVPFRGVNYNEMVMFSTGERVTAEVTVYETGASPADIAVEAQTIFLEPHRDHLRVSEFYAVSNRSQPQRTYGPETGSFRFALPEPVGDLQVSAGRSGSVPLRQQPQPTEKKNEFAIHFPFHPGETEVQVSYAVPMGENALDLTLPLTVAAERRHLAVPREGARVESAALKEIEQSRVPKARVYSIQAPVPGSLQLRLEVDPEALAAASSAAPEVPEAPQPRSAVNIVPHPVSRAQWYIVGLSVAVLLLGLYYLGTLDPGQSSGRAPRIADESARQAEHSRH